MDRMTKLVARRLSAEVPAGQHPAPELLSAFAENALSDAERGSLVQHLATCSDCREILYLALPDSQEIQKVLVPQRRPFTFRRWIFGWGALAASVAVAAVFFSTHRVEDVSQSPSPAATALKITPTNGPATAPAPAPALANDNGMKVAADKAPQELVQLQTAQDAVHRDSNKARMAVPAAKSEPKPQPEARRMTAKPQANLDFDESGQVRVSAPGSPTAASSDEISESEMKSKSAGSRVQNLPLEGRNLGALTSVAPAASTPVPAIPQTIGGPLAGKNAIGSAYSRPDLDKKTLLVGNLGGTVLDASGAAVANARVTIVGQSGERSVTSDAAGKFAFEPLPSGSYSLRAGASGFKTTEITQLAVLDDKLAALDVRLEVGTASEAVEVTGAAPVVAQSGDSAGASAGYQSGQSASQDFDAVGAVSARAPQKSPMDASLTRLPPLQWTLSPEGDVQRSGDSGKTWQPISVAPGISFRALSAVGVNIWVGGKAGALYHSADSGQTWVEIEPPTRNRKLDQDIVRVDFPDALNGTVSTANGAVWKTSDGGKSWQIK